MLNPTSLRTLFLAATCCELKATVIDQQTKITALEERSRSDATKIADLMRRNQDVTKALHRQAASGHAALDVLAVIAFCAVIAAAILLCIADEPGLH